MGVTALFRARSPLWQNRRLPSPYDQQESVAMRRNAERRVALGMMAVRYAREIALTILAIHPLIELFK